MPQPWPRMSGAESRSKMVKGISFLPNLKNKIKNEALAYPLATIE